MTQLIKKIPVVRAVAKVIYFSAIAPFQSFPGSEDYWKQRYKSGRNSGAGSYGALAEFKADVLNEFVENRQVETIIEYGCGDGNQLRLARYKSYVGFDVSLDAISQCRALFESDDRKRFKLMSDYVGETAQLTLSLDVIYHLIEAEVFHNYMNRLFDSSTKFVIIYSTNTDREERFQAAHVKHRNFSNWVSRNKPEWAQVQHIANRYPYKGDEVSGSAADFYIYEKPNPSDDI